VPSQQQVQSHLELALPPQLLLDGMLVSLQGRWSHDLHQQSHDHHQQSHCEQTQLQLQLQLQWQAQPQMLRLTSLTTLRRAPAFDPLLMAA